MLLDWLPRVMLKRVRVSGEECGNTGKVKDAGTEPAAVAEEFAILAAELKGMPSVKPTEGVRGDERCIAAHQRDNRRPSDVQIASGDADPGQSNSLVDTVADAEGGRVVRRMRSALARETIETNADFIHRITAEGVRLV